MEAEKPIPNGTPPPASKLQAIAFLAFSTAYYVLFFVLFSDRLAGYLKDVCRRFEFVRRLLG
jgi:hypothetical protein